MSTTSLGALSTLAFQHQPKNEDFIALQVRSTKIAHESEASRAESVHEMGRLPNIYQAERSRRPSALSGRGSYASDLPQLGALSDSLKSAGEVICTSRPRSTISAAASPKTTAREKKAGLIQFFAICWCIYVVGWHDGSSGPLLPRIQQEYQVRLAVVLCRSTPHEDNHCSFHSPLYQRYS